MLSLASLALIAFGVTIAVALILTLGAWGAFPAIVFATIVGYLVALREI